MHMKKVKRIKNIMYRKYLSLTSLPPHLDLRTKDARNILLKTLSKRCDLFYYFNNPRPKAAVIGRKKIKDLLHLPLLMGLWTRDQQETSYPVVPRPEHTGFTERISGMKKSGATVAIQASG